MAIYDEIFKVRKDIHNLNKRLEELRDQSKSKGSSKFHNEMNEITNNLEHLKIRMCILERLRGSYIVN